MPGTKLQIRLGRIVEDQLDSYLSVMYAAGISDPQRTEIRKSFFAGVTVLLGMLEIIGETEEISEEDGGQILESIRDECLRFSQGLPPNDPKPFIWTPGSTH